MLFSILFCLPVLFVFVYECIYSIEMTAHIGLESYRCTLLYCRYLWHGIALHRLEKFITKYLQSTNILCRCSSICKYIYIHIYANTNI